MCSNRCCSFVHSYPEAYQVNIHIFIEIRVIPGRLRRGALGRLRSAQQFGLGRLHEFTVDILKR